MTLVPVKIIGTTVMRPREQVEKTIREAITSGELRSGEVLPPEAELARQFKVSRSTLREALRVLASQNLIHKVPGARGGTFVKAIDYRALGSSVSDTVSNLLALGSIRFDEVTDARMYLEIPSARLASVNRSSAQVDMLSDIVKRESTIPVDSPDVPTLDRQFHATIAEASGNRVLAGLVAALHQSTEPVHYLELSPEVGRKTVLQHKAVVRAIRAQDADEAERAIIAHLLYLSKHFTSHAG